jgi:hypothetical protein
MKGPFVKGAVPFFLNPAKLPAEYHGRPGKKKRGRPERWEHIMPGYMVDRIKEPFERSMQNWKDREKYGQGLPMLSNRVPDKGFAPQAHRANLANAWAPWFGGRELTADERRLVNPPAYTAPRDRISPKQVPKQVWEKPPVNPNTGRPLQEGRAQGPARGRWIDDPLGGTMDDPSGAHERILGQVTPDMENVLEEQRRLGYAPSGGADFNPQWGTVGGMGPTMGWNPPLEEEPPPEQPSVPRAPEDWDMPPYEKPIGGGKERDWGRPGGAPVVPKGQPAGMAAGEPSGRQREGGMAAGGQQVGGQAAGCPAPTGGMAAGAPVTDLDQFMTWMRRDSEMVDGFEGVDLLYKEFVRNGWELPDDWEVGYKEAMERGRWHDTDGWHSPESRNQTVLDYVRDMLLQAKAGYLADQPDPTQTDPNTENIPGLEDRDMTEGTGFPWAPDLTDPGSQDTPAWVDTWQDLISEYMPQVADQYRAVANQGVYGPAGMQTIRAPLQNATNKVLGSMEPWLNETTAGIRQSEANQRRRALQATEAGMGKAGAQRPRAPADLIASNITMPSMVAESDRIFGAHQDMKSLSDRLIMGMGEFDTNLTRENMLSKSQVGLPGMAGTFGQMQDSLARRDWDKSMENKFGWSPERQGETQSRIMDYFRDKDFVINWNMGQQNAMLGDWGLSRSQQRQYQYTALLMELKHNYDKEMQELFGDDWFDKMMGAVGVGVKAYAASKGG